jgi:hypothetical protein
MDRAGVGGYRLGEHRGDDFAVSAPEITLAAIASPAEWVTPTGLLWTS